MVKKIYYYALLLLLGELLLTLVMLSHGETGFTFFGFFLLEALTVAGIYKCTLKL